MSEALCLSQSVADGKPLSAPVSASAVFTLTPLMAAGFGWLLLRQVLTARMALALAIGGTVRAGRYLGEGRTDAASAIFSKCLMATLALALTGALVGFLFHDGIYRVLGASPDIYPLMSEYFLVIIWVLVAQLVTMVLYYFVRVDGFPGLAPTALVTGAAANILLDALLVGDPEGTTDLILKISGAGAPA